MEGIEIKPLIINPTHLCVKSVQSQAENDGEEPSSFGESLSEQLNTVLEITPQVIVGKVVAKKSSEFELEEAKRNSIPNESLVLGLIPASQSKCSSFATNVPLQSVLSQSSKVFQRKNRVHAV